MIGEGDLRGLDAPEREERLSALRMIVGSSPGIFPEPSREVNNHVHTIYSFSPYSPAKAAFQAKRAGLMAVGAMDHDSVAGCVEMLDAGAILGIATTVGFEIRVSFDGTAIEGRKINNPDSDGVGYIAVHGIPRRMIGEAASFLEPVRAARDRRNREMVDRLGAIAERYGVRGPVFSEVRDLSRARERGSLTERHILYAFALRIIERTGRGCLLCDFLSEEMGLDLPDRIRGYLEDPDNPHYVYDLLGVLKSSFLKEIYLQPGADECRPVAEVIELSERIGAISAYAYLGDVTESPTGDKKAERFEDGYLDELFDVISSLGFRAVTYMPPRNTVEQLRRVRRLCREHGLMEISGVDINSSRQSFNCPELLRPDFEHLIDAAWALIAHEKLSDCAPRLGLFDRRNPLAGLSLDKRIAAYARAGRELDHHAPWDTAATVKHLEDPV